MKHINCPTISKSFRITLMICLLCGNIYVTSAETGIPDCYLYQGINPDEASEISYLVTEFHRNICRDLKIDHKIFEKNCMITIAFKNPATGRANYDVTTLLSKVIQTRSKVKYRATLEILHPDFFDGSQSNILGHSFDQRYYHKLLIHELSTCYIEYLLSIKEHGWRHNDMPNWFRQGLEEYYGLMYSDPYWKNDGINDYFAYHVGPNGGINFQFGIFPQNPYFDGVVLFLFFHEYYGNDTIRNILMSDKADLGAAMADILRIDLSQLSTEFQNWRKQRIEAQNP